MPASPPPLPPPRKNRIGFIIAILGTLVVIGMAAAITLGFMTLRRAQAKAAASRATLKELQQTTDAQRKKMADVIESGEPTGGDAMLGTMKEQLEKSAAQLSGGDAAAARAMASLMGKIQAQLRDYAATVTRMTEAEVFSFKIREKATIRTHRQLVHDFLAHNARLTDTLENAEAMVRAELEQAKVPARVREATVAGYLRSQQTSRPLQRRIRATDKTLGDAALAILDQLEKNWGKWRQDETQGALVFDDDRTLESHNALIEKIQAASAEQARAQEELARALRAK